MTQNTRADIEDVVWPENRLSLSAITIRAASVMKSSSTGRLEYDIAKTACATREISRLCQVFVREMNSYHRDGRLR